uniref:Uncharacterized protein n=1 Tax=Cucumis melo TaxID=3656 RepID=A0A9I9E863_CUCME
GKLLGSDHRVGYKELDKLCDVLPGILPNRVIQPIAEHSDYPVERIGEGWMVRRPSEKSLISFIFRSSTIPSLVLPFFRATDHSVTEVDQPNPSSRRRPDESFTATPTLDRPFFHRRAIDHSSVGLPSPLYVVKVLLQSIGAMKPYLRQFIDV